MPGILAVNLEPGAADRIRKVNIIAREGTRSRGQIVQDTISLVFVRSGDRLTADAVDVIECSDDGLVSVAGRPRLSTIEVEDGAGGRSVTIGLSREGRAFLGSAAVGSGTSRTGLMRSGVEATLRAAEAMMADRLTFSVMDLRTLQCGGEAIVLLVVVPTPPVGNGLLVGSTRIQGDPVEAAARAALDAINRTFTF